MSSTRPTRRRRPAGRTAGLLTRTLAIGLAVGIGGTLAPAAWGVAGATGKPQSRQPLGPAPLTSAFVSGGRTWLVLPMGYLSQPDNTFWQLLERSGSSGAWTLVTPPGVADNAGLAVSAAADGAVQAAVLPSQDLHFSPLATTDDGGADWTPEVLPDPLADLPDALSGTAPGTSVAIGGSGRLLLERGAGGGSWRTLVSASSLARSPSGADCGVTRLQAADVTAGGAVLVGTTCTRPGRAGIFVLSGPAVSALGVDVPRQALVRVLRLMPVADGTAALLSLRDAGGAQNLRVALLSSSGNGTTLSPPLAVAPGSTLLASGTGSGDELFVLLRKVGGGDELATEGTGGWDVLPAPPRGTLAAALSPGRIDAVTVHTSTLTDFSLAPGATTWQQVQVLRVPVQYGSSS